MSKYICLIVLGMTVLQVQAQIPNGGFELWESFFNFEKPLEWGTNLDTVHRRIEKDTFAIEGKYSLKLVSVTGSSWGNCSSQVYSTVGLDEPLPASSFLSFYAKVLPLDPEKSNSGYLRAYVNAYSGPENVATFQWINYQSIDEFTEIQIPLNANNIDSIHIQLDGGGIGSPVDGPCYYRSTAWVDGMTIHTNTSGSNTPLEDNVDIIVYPNPTNGLVFINPTNDHDVEYQVFSTIGNLISSGPVRNSQIFIPQKGTFVLNLIISTGTKTRTYNKLIVVN